MMESGSCLQVYLYFLNLQVGFKGLLFEGQSDSIIMIRAPLTFHSPEDIYHFLRNNVGPLYMAIKHGQAIIHFVRNQDAQKALEKYRHGIVNHYPLQLSPYEEGDIPASAPRPNPLPENPVPQGEVVVPPPAESQLSMLIRSHLQQADPNDDFQLSTKDNKQELIKFLLNFTTPLQAAKKKRQEIEALQDQGLKTLKMKQFSAFYKKALNDIRENTQDTYRAFRKKCAKFGEQENIDLEPTIRIAKPAKSRSESQGYKVNIEHVNPDFQGLKRIGVLNNQNFVCTAFNYSKGQLLYFKSDDQHLQMSTEIKEGAYGLLVLDNHVLVGTYQGNISFYTAPEFTQRQISLPLHNGMIYEVFKHSERVGGYNLMTIGCDNLLKLWNASDQKITEQESTLFFEQSLRISHNLQQISSVDVLGPGSRIAYSCQKNLLLHDCVKEAPTATIVCKKKILKISALDENNIATANQTFVSFVDTRNNANTLELRFDKGIRTLTCLGPHSVFYGCEDGEVGLSDRRKTKPVWRNTLSHGIHKGKIYDVAKMGELVISADSKGQVTSWSPTKLLQSQT